MLDPYIKIFASYILLDERMKTLSNEDLGSLVRCWALASNSGGSIPADPTALGKLLGIRPSSAVKLLPMLRQFFTDFREISPSFLEDFQEFVESLYTDFGKSEGRIYSALVLSSLGPYAKIVSNNREIAARGTGRKLSKSGEKSDTTRSTTRDTSCTCTNKNDVSLFVPGEEDCDPEVSGILPGKKGQGPLQAIEPASMQDGGSIPPVMIAKAWNAMVKAMGRADLEVTKKTWAVDGPMIEASLAKKSEQDHFRGIAFVETWGSQWWCEAKNMTIKSFLKKVPEYAEKGKTTQPALQAQISPEKFPRVAVSKFTPDDLAKALGRHPRGAEVWGKLQEIFPRVQPADAIFLMDMLAEGITNPDELLRSAEHKSTTVSGPEFMPSLAKWLSEGGYLLHCKPLTTPTKAHGKLRQNITGGIDLAARAKAAGEARMAQSKLGNGQPIPISTEAEGNAE